jgi:hypothetical protein
MPDGTRPPFKDRVTVVSMEQDFGPNGIGGAWCDDPNMLAISGGAELSSADVANDVAVRSSWPYVADPANPADRNGWKVQLNAPPRRSGDGHGLCRLRRGEVAHQRRARAGGVRAHSAHADAPS